MIPFEGTVLLYEPNFVFSVHIVVVCATHQDFNCPLIVTPELGYYLRIEQMLYFISLGFAGDCLGKALRIMVCIKAT